MGDELPDAMELSRNVPLRGNADTTKRASAPPAMLQYSVYVHYVASEDSDETLRRKVHAALPSHGQVRIISVTDRQFEKMEIYVGKKRKPVEDPPVQLGLF